eukprot:TRINITY_DN38404_c0_g1_i1.p1 TRINITY_DN38404_c0_g1~~TRINITY_DN38404_c0_g1_i1.p1  ORF type:complete len:779 (+),score=94.78 TRINITY_DN38404_c0_g1_i1:100-2436(+)
MTGPAGFSAIHPATKEVSLAAELPKDLAEKVEDVHTTGGTGGGGRGALLEPDGTGSLSHAKVSKTPVAFEDTFAGNASLKPLGPLKRMNSLLSKLSFATSPSCASDASVFEGTVRWQWEHRTGFRDYRQQEQLKIEHGFRAGESKVRVKSGKASGVPMEIFFHDMLQFDPVTSHSRKVQRVGPYPWWMKTQRMARALLRSWHTGTPLRETLDDYQNRRLTMKRKALLRGSQIFSLNPQSIFGAVVESNWFLLVTMLAVVGNVLWIAYEADQDPSRGVDPIFAYVENLFCAVFTMEILIRFLAFKPKRNCIFDGWFRFDAFLVLCMVFETWIEPLILVHIGILLFDRNYSSVTVLRVLRLVRLIRLARIVKVVDELYTLVKGIAHALRSICIALTLLFLLVYCFAIAFRLQTKPVVGETVDSAGWEERRELEATYFSTVSHSMWTLFVHAALLDDVADILSALVSTTDAATCGLFLLMILASNLTVMNMLIGITVEVVATYKRAADSQRALEHVTISLIGLLECYDRNDDGCICRPEFELLVRNPEMRSAMEKFGVDLDGLVTLADVIYDDHKGRTDGEEGGEEGDPKIPIEDFLNLLQRLQGVQSASVTDVVELREYVKNRVGRVETSIKETQDTLRAGLEGLQASLAKVSQGLEQAPAPSRVATPHATRPAPPHLSELPARPLTPVRPLAAAATTLTKVTLTKGGAPKTQWHKHCTTIGDLAVQCSSLLKGYALADPCGVELGLELTLSDVLQSQGSEDSVTLHLIPDVWCSGGVLA